MSRATSNHTTKPLSTLFRDPFLRATFEAAERDGLAPALVEVDHPRTLDGGATAEPRYGTRALHGLIGPRPHLIFAAPSARRGERRPFTREGSPYV
jgi:hypothetical protein